MVCQNLLHPNIGLQRCTLHNYSHLIKVIHELFLHLSTISLLFLPSKNVNVFPKSANCWPESLWQLILIICALHLYPNLIIDLVQMDIIQNLIMVLAAIQKEKIFAMEQHICRLTGLRQSPSHFLPFTIKTLQIEAPHVLQIIPVNSQTTPC